MNKSEKSDTEDTRTPAIVYDSILCEDDAFDATETRASPDPLATPYNANTRQLAPKAPKLGKKIVSNGVIPPKKNLLSVKLNLEECILSDKPWETYVLQLVSCFQSLRDIIKSLPETKTGLEAAKKAIRMMAVQIDQVTTGQIPLGNDLIAEAKQAIENMQQGNPVAKKWSIIFEKCSKKNK